MVHGAFTLVTVAGMDLNTVEVVDRPTRREEVWPLGAGDAVLAGGTWLFSEPNLSCAGSWTSPDWGGRRSR